VSFGLAGYRLTRGRLDPVQVSRPRVRGVGSRVSPGERGRFGVAARRTRLPGGLDGRVRGTVPCRRPAQRRPTR